MASRAKIALSALAAVGVAAGLGACGTQGVDVPTSSTYHAGAVLFLDHCSGCHTLSVVGAEGSASSVQNRVRTNGPNFNFRPETVTNVMYAIENGGFSGQIMPQNVVVGPQAHAVAEFLAHYAGADAPKVPTLALPSGQ
jgi:mono/diheme cytochrome c family protein